MSDRDPSDPALRAAQHLQRAESHERSARVLGALALIAAAAGFPFAAEPLTGDPGATVGAVVAAPLLIGLAVALWPQEWSAREREHHRLDGIWRAARPASEPAPWDQFAAWAETDSGRIRLLLLQRAPVKQIADGAPSPYSVSSVKCLDAYDMTGAAQEMELLRSRAEEMELRSRQALDESRDAARQAELDSALIATEQAARAHEEQREAEAKAELEAAEASDRRAQADAVARALRRR